MEKTQDHAVALMAVELENACARCTSQYFTANIQSQGGSINHSLGSARGHMCHLQFVLMQNHSWYPSCTWNHLQKQTHGRRASHNKYLVEQLVDPVGSLLAWKMSPLEDESHLPPHHLNHFFKRHGGLVETIRQEVLNEAHVAASGARTLHATPTFLLKRRCTGGKRRVESGS